MRRWRRSSRELRATLTERGRAWPRVDAATLRVTEVVMTSTFPCDRALGGLQQAPSSSYTLREVPDGLRAAARRMP